MRFSIAASPLSADL